MRCKVCVKIYLHAQSAYLACCMLVAPLNIPSHKILGCESGGGGMGEVSKHEVLFSMKIVTKFCLALQFYRLRGYKVYTEAASYTLTSFFLLSLIWEPQSSFCCKSNIFSPTSFILSPRIDFNESIPPADRYDIQGCRTSPPGYIGWRNRFLRSFNVYKIQAFLVQYRYTLTHASGWHFI
jgi:hypothetical protein